MRSMHHTEFSRDAGSSKSSLGYDLWERDQSTIWQICDEFYSFIDGIPVLLGERETLLSWRLEEVQ